MDQLLKIVFVENSAEGLAIVITLIVLLAISVYFALSHTARYQGVETNLLEKVIDRLRRMVNSKEVDDPRYVIEQLITCIPREGKGRLRDSLIGDRLLAILKMRGSQAKVNVQALQEMSIAKENSRKGLGFPSFVIGFAMLLGLLGTIIGLTRMVQTIHLTLPSSADSLTPDKWSQSLDHVRDVLSSMKSAFSATLVGLICSITSSLLNLRLEKVQSRLFEKLERFTVEELLPRTAPSIEDETLLENVSKQMERYFDELQEVAERNNQTIQELSAAQKAFGITIAHVEQMSKGSSAGGVQEVIGHLTGVIGELHSTNEAVVKLTDRLPETLEVSRKANQVMQQQVSSLLDGHRQWQTRLDNSLSGVTKTLPELVSQLQRNRYGGGHGTEQAADSPRRPGQPSANIKLLDRSPDRPLSQRLFFVYGGAALFLLIAALIWLR
jgi:biopolymer transport protein ExbB/TolQ